MPRLRLATLAWLVVGSASAARCPAESRALLGPEDLLRFSHALRRDRFSEAVACYERLTSDFPQFAEGWFELGQALTESGRTSEAVAAMQKGFQLAPSAPSGRVLDYGRALQQLSRLDEASAAYKAVVAQSPDDADALKNELLLPAKRSLFEEIRPQTETCTCINTTE